jgi:hypothetical protein
MRTLIDLMHVRINSFDVCTLIDLKCALIQLLRALIHLMHTLNQLLRTLIHFITYFP